MTNSFLSLPKRTQKPRKSGQTFLIDNGLPTQRFKDVVESFNGLIDYIKLGWCTSLVSPNTVQKISIAQEHDVKIFLGGTFFEKSLLQGKLGQYIEFNKSLGLKQMEVSNGTIDLSNEEKARHIKELAGSFEIFSEVGYKDAIKSRDLPPVRWIEYIKQDLAAGASKVILEARESGKSGICREDGEVRYGLISEVLQSEVNADDLIFEAPNKSLQEYFIKLVGANVNLGNIAFDDVIGVETLRQGLRSDTLLHFEGKDA